MSDTTGKKQSHGFQPGQSGNPAGRPKGSRNKLGEKFLAALCDDFGEHGVAAIQRVRKENPSAYVKICASIIPKQMQFEVNDLSRGATGAFSGRLFASKFSKVVNENNRAFRLLGQQL